VPLQPPPRSIVVIDASALTEADAAVVETLMRLQLHAQRHGASIRLDNAPRALVDLLVLCGLSEVLPVVPMSGVGSGVEVQRKIEEWEEGRVDEEVDRGDPPA
jgi:anti-anti-sigma regulatory factor